MLDTILWQELPLAQDMAAGVSSIRTDLRSNNIAMPVWKDQTGGDVSKDCCPEGISVARERK